MSANPNAFDLDDLQQDDTADMEVINPRTAEPTGWIITFAGPGHEKAVKLKNSTLRRNLKRARKGNEEATPEDVERDSLDNIVGRIVTWSGATKGGQPLEFSHEVARDLLGNPKYQWLRTACAIFLNDEASFMKGSAKV